MFTGVRGIDPWPYKVPIVWGLEGGGLGKGPSLEKGHLPPQTKSVHRAIKGKSKPCFTRLPTGSPMAPKPILLLGVPGQVMPLWGYRVTETGTWDQSC